MSSPSLDQDIADLTAMVDGDLYDIAQRAHRIYLGTGRAKSLPAGRPSYNVMRKYLSVVARCLQPSAVSGCDTRVLDLLRDASPPIQDLPTGYVPMPTSLLEGDGKDAGLRRCLEYLCGVGLSACQIDYAPRSGRLYIRPIKPTAIKCVRYADDDPTQIVRIEIARQMQVGAVERDVVVAWDTSDEASPYMAILVGGREVTEDVPGLSDRLDDLRGAGYLWRYQDGRPFIPVVVWGRKEDAYRLSFLSSATMESIARRASALQVSLDCGFPSRNVRGLRPPSTSKDGEAYIGSGPGDVTMWVMTGEDTAEHWEWDAGGDPEAMARSSHSSEMDTISQLGVPLDLTATGGEPLAEEIRRQNEASQSYADTMRGGLFAVFRRLSALANVLGLVEGSPANEYGFRFLLGSEVAASKKPEPPPSPKTPKPPEDDPEDDDVEDPEDPQE